MEEYIFILRNIYVYFYLLQGSIPWALYHSKLRELWQMQENQLEDVA
jgi:uncharacterized protein YjiS (DUF1127 family)